METKIFSEIEKKMEVKILKDFEKEVRTKIINKFETLRKKNHNLSRVLLAGESDMWTDIRNGKYIWLGMAKGKKKRLFRLIDIYSNFSEMLDKVEELNKKVDKVKRLKDLPDNDESPMEEN